MKSMSVLILFLTPCHMRQSSKCFVIPLVIPLLPPGVSGSDDDDDDVIYIVVGAAVGLLLVLAVIAIIIIIVCARSRRKKKSGKYAPDYVGYGRWFLCWVSGSVSIC